MEETVIVSVQVEGYQQLEEAIAASAKLAQERKQLQADLKAGTKTEAEYAKAIVENSKSLTEARLKESELRREVQASAKERTAATGSLTQMRAELGRLKKSYADLSKAEREAAKGTELNKRINDLTAEVSGIEQSIGVFSRNVGNYAGSLSPLFEGLGDKIQGLGGNFSSMTGGFVQGAKGIAGGLQNSGIAASGFGKAMAAIPIFTIIQAFQILMDWLGKFDGALDGFEQGFAAVKAAMQPVVEFLSTTVGEAINAVIGYFKTLGNVAMAVFKTLTGDLEGAKVAMQDAQKSAQGVVDSFGNVANAAVKMGGAIGDAAMAAAALKKEMQDLEAAEAELAFQQVAARKRIAQFETLAADKTLTLQQRNEALNKAKVEALRISAEEDKVAARKARALVNEVLQTQNLNDQVKLTGEFTTSEIEAIMANIKARDEQGKILGVYEEQVKKLTDAFTQQQEAEQSGRDIELDYAAKSSKIRKQLETEQAEQHKAAEERRKQRMEAAQKELEEQQAQVTRLLELRASVAKSDEDQMRAQQAILANQLEADRKAAKSKEERLLLTQRYEQAVAQLEADYQAKKMQAQAEAQKQLDDFRASVEGQELAAIERANTLRLAAITEATANGQLTKQEADAAILQSEADHLQALLDYQIKYGKDTVDVQNRINQARIKSNEEAAAKQARIEQAQLQVTRNVVNGIGNVMQVLAQNESQGVAFQRLIALTNIAISTGEAIAGIVKIAAKSSTDPIMFAVQLTGGIATVLANIAQAASIIGQANEPQAPAPQKAAKGGLIGGNLHMNGGTMIEAERGEAIMTRSAVSQYGPLLDQINQLSGGSAISQQSAAMLTTGNSLAQQQLSDSVAGMSVNIRDIERVRGNSARPRDVAKF